MASSNNDTDIYVCLVGKTGHGKSCTGNMILGIREFESKISATSVTKSCQIAYGHVQDKVVTVVDGPGLADTDMSSSEALKKMIEESEQVVLQCPDGFDAILIVVPVTARFTEEEVIVIKRLNGIFGENYTQKYGIVVMTHGDSYDPDENEQMSFEQWAKKQEGYFKQLMESCCGRVVLFDNKSKDEKVREEQVRKLLDLINQMRNASDRYTPVIFKAAQSARDRVLLSTKEPVYRQETEKEIQLIRHDLEKLDSKDPEYVPELTDLKEKTKKLLDDMTKRDKGTGVLRNVISHLQILKELIGDRISSKENDKEWKKKMEEMRAETKQLNKERTEKMSGFEVLSWIEKVLSAVAAFTSVGSNSVDAVKSGFAIDAILKRT